MRWFSGLVTLLASYISGDFWDARVQSSKHLTHACCCLCIASQLEILAGAFLHGLKHSFAVQVQKKPAIKQGAAHSIDMPVPVVMHPYIFAYLPWLQLT